MKDTNNITFHPQALKEMERELLEKEEQLYYLDFEISTKLLEVEHRTILMKQAASRGIQQRMFVFLLGFMTSTLMFLLFAA